MFWANCGCTEGQGGCVDVSLEFFVQRGKSLFFFFWHVRIRESQRRWWPNLGGFGKLLLLVGFKMLSNRKKVVAFWIHLVTGKGKKCQKKSRDLFHHLLLDFDVRKHLLNYWSQYSQREALSVVAVVFIVQGTLSRNLQEWSKKHSIKNKVTKFFIGTKFSKKNTRKWITCKKT